MTDLKVIDGKRGHAHAFLELEPDICDLVRMAELVDLADDSRDSGLLTFAVGAIPQDGRGPQTKILRDALGLRFLRRGAGCDWLAPR